MSELTRFGVSLDDEILTQFDKHIKEKDFPTRSKAIEHLIREELIKSRTHSTSRNVAGIITMLYDHHRRQLVNNLLDIQHDFQTMIVSTQHIHLTHDRCLEVIVVKGKGADVQKLADSLKSEKGVQHVELTVTSAEH